MAIIEGNSCTVDFRCPFAIIIAGSLCFSFLDFCITHMIWYTLRCLLIASTKFSVLEGACI